MQDTSAPTQNPTLLAWVKECQELVKPARSYWCNGSEEEKEALTKEAVDTGVFIPLNPKKLPGCYLHRSNPNDVARVEQLTFICTPTKEGAGTTNNWMEPKEAYDKLRKLYEGAMEGRTMYIIPYVMGPVGSPFAKIGIQITDSIYVVLNMRIMTRMGSAALKMLGDSDEFNRGLHAVRDCHPDRRFICHFPQDNTIWSIGSGYGGNALLGKKCLSLRIGSYLGKTEGWLAEHMLVMGVENPYGQITYVAAAFPSQCGKTNFAMMHPPQRFRNWKIWTVGDDLAWLRPGEDGRLWAINPENGYFGVAPGTNNLSNPNAMASIQKDTIYTNVALTEDGDVWWEGKTDKVPEGKMWDWQGRPWAPGTAEKAAHPNSRFTAPAENNPCLSRHFNDPSGVPISAIIFGGRRATTVPLVMQSFNWTHGVYMGATLGSETTAAAQGAVGILRRDPMAMLPFCGYNMGEYWGHWLHMQSKIPHPPRIFMVNWFRKDKAGKFLWPGFGENMRVLKWILDRSLGAVGAQETQMGWVPHEGYLDLSGLNIPTEQIDEACKVDLEEWRKELNSADDWFKSIGSKLPKGLELTRQFLLASIDAAEYEESHVEAASKGKEK